MRTLPPLRKLLLSHVDAWCVALIAASLPLFVHQAFSARTLYLLAAMTGGAWLAFAVNDYFDAPHDRHDPVKARRNFFVTHPLPPRRALGWALGISALLAPAFLQYGARGLLIALAGVLAFWAYSAPPARLKSRPGLDLLTHMLFVETYPIWGTLLLLGVPWTRLDATLLTIGLLASLTAQLEQQARDYEVDRQTDRNFTTTVGLRANLLLLRTGTALLIGFTLWRVLDGTIPVAIGVLALIALPMLLYRFAGRTWRPQGQRLSYLLALLAAVYFVVLLAVQQ